MLKGKIHLLFIITLILIWSCKPTSSRESNFPEAIPKKEIIIDGLAHPWSMCFLSENDILISEKDGNLIRFHKQTKEKLVIKGFPTDLVDSIRVKDFRDNSGIFEVVKHPKFDENRWIYVSYASENLDGTTTKVIRAKLESDSLSQIETIFIATPYRFDLFHYGGGMVFGKDEKLYFTIGERFYNEIDQPTLPVAQDITDKRGKIYRLNDDGSIPNDNPDFGEKAVPGMYAIGIRAAQGITVNPDDGNIWFSEHGSFEGDELNLLQTAANYGWPIKTMGKYRNPEYHPPKMENMAFTAPIHYWMQTIAPTGLTFYNGEEFPTWNGDLLLAGLSRGSLWRLHLEENIVVSVEELFVNDRIRLRKVAVSPGGKLYILTDEPDGKLVEIKNATSSQE